jgi:hypothetical protein
MGKTEFRRQESEEGQMQEYPPSPRLGGTSWKNGILEEWAK